MAWDVEDILGEFYEVYASRMGMTYLAHTVKHIVTGGQGMDSILRSGPNDEAEQLRDDCVLALDLYVELLRGYDSFRVRETSPSLGDRYGTMVDFVFGEYKRLTGHSHLDRNV